MKNLGKIIDKKDIITKEYLEESMSDTLAPSDAVEYTEVEISNLFYAVLQEDET